MDPVLTEIMKNRFAAMAEEAATVAYRTAHTTFVKQTQDFQVALARPSGEFFAYPVMTGDTTGFGHSVKGLIAAAGPDPWAPGDVLISNDPFSGDGIVTHTMDIHLMRPVFFEGAVIAFAWSFVHASDIGGAVPGSISPDLVEVYQEGIRLRPTKLFRAGQLNQDVANILRDNSRIGDAVWGDLEAVMAAMQLLENRATALCRRVGPVRFAQGIENVLAYAELKARGVIARLTDGSYEFMDYVEGPGPDDAIHIHCRLTIAGDEAWIDYTGSSPQVHAAFNLPTGSGPHPFLCLGLTNYIQTIEPSIPLNGGVLRPIHAYAPPGTIMNAILPAAMGNRWVTAMRIYDALVGCLNQAIVGGIAACGSGQAGIISGSWTDPANGLSRVAVVEPFSGGSGGRVNSDGVDGNDVMIGYLKSTPLEHVEAETPLIVRCHELIEDRIGHGQFRGGAGVRIDIECRAPEAQIVVRGLDRFRFQPWGAFGGLPGHCGRAVLNPDGNAQELGRIKVLTMREGDLLRMESPTGGGFGLPTDREPGLVLQDVRDGLISPDEAEAAYKVAIRDGLVDVVKTEALRLGWAKTDSDWRVTYGPERLRYEGWWPVEVSVSIAEAIMSIPIGLRRAVQEWTLNQLRQDPGQIDPATARACVFDRAHASGANLTIPQSARDRHDPWQIS